MRRPIVLVLVAAAALLVLGIEGRSPVIEGSPTADVRLDPCPRPVPGSVPSFCVAPPVSAPIDRAELLGQRQEACDRIGPAEAPDFCLVMPSTAASTAALRRELALTLLRQRLGSDLRRIGAPGLQLWAEAGVAGPITDQAIRVLAADRAAVEAYFGLAFHESPAVFLFTSRQSFSLAMQRQFGVDLATSVRLSQQLLGVLLTGSDAVAINGENIVTSGRPVVYRHELAHVLIHQLAGDGVPAWIDEGLATRISTLDAASVEPTRGAALSMLKSDRRALTIFSDRQDWQAVNTGLGGLGYGVAAIAVSLIERRIGAGGVASLLSAVGHGAAFDDAFSAAMGQSLEDFISLLPSLVRGDVTDSGRAQRPWPATQVARLSSDWRAPSAA